MKKGFITVATGPDHYYMLAANLLKSYKLFASNPLPFAILADRENEYTKLFDNVIILENATKSYLDKLFLLNNIPYDETMFIESDILIYKDINFFFDAFKDATDFSMFGENHSLEEDLSYGGKSKSKKEWGWFDPKKTGKYYDRIKWIPQFCSDFIYMKRGGVCKEASKICMDVWHNYKDYDIRLLDDTVFAIAMAATGCKCVPNSQKYNKCVFCHMIVNGWKPKPNYYKGNCVFTRPDKRVAEEAFICHWGTKYTKKIIYRREARILDCMIEKNDFKKRILYLVYSACIPINNFVDYLIVKFKKIQKKLKNFLKIKR